MEIYNPNAQEVQKIKKSYFRQSSKSIFKALCMSQNNISWIVNARLKIYNIIFLL